MQIFVIIWWKIFRWGAVPVSQYAAYTDDCVDGNRRPNKFSVFFWLRNILIPQWEYLSLAVRVMATYYLGNLSSYVGVHE